MVGDHGAAPAHRGPSRRAFLRSSTAVALSLPVAAVLGGVAAAQPAPLDDVTVRPREEWAQGLRPVGPLAAERPGDVRFLLVHHTASSNAYGPQDVPALIRGFFSFHTGATKNWPDVAYNFFVDRYGTAWEGRAGSLAGPVQPDATGGSQGFAQLCCFIGDHSVEAPTEPARQTMLALLAALAERYGVDTRPGATTTFVSRGSNRWPAGAVVTAPTIAGHRDVSLTSCPGDAAYPLVRDSFPTEVTALRAARAVPAVPEETVAAGPPVPEETVAAPPPVPAAPSAPGPVATPSPHSPDATATTEGGDVDAATAAVVAGGVLTVGTAVGLYVRGRGRRSAAVLDGAGTPPDDGATSGAEHLP